MSTYIPETILSWWRSTGHNKQSPSGWITGNAVCCVHNGTTKDTRSRGGIRYHEGGIQINCFNCGFKTGWTPGRPVSSKLKKFMGWLGIPDDEVTKCVIDAMRNKDSIGHNKFELLLPSFSTISLPDGAKLITEHVNHPKILPVLEYLTNRGLFLDDYDWYWSPKMADRLIIPFKYQNRIVGYTGRAVSQYSKNKYLNEQQPGYVFNLDKQTYDKKFVIVCEGPIDAISIDGVSVQGNTLNSTQKVLINQLQKDVIVVPDKDHAGKELVDYALDAGWSVSFPRWDRGIKDINDAIKKYGRLYTLYNIVQSVQQSTLKINLISKSWFNR